MPMIEPRSPIEQLMYCTVRIVGDLPDGSSNVGTGFFYLFPTSDKKKVLTLVTNKHVISGIQRATIVVHTHAAGATKPDGNVPIKIEGGLGAPWVEHPNGIDLCAIAITSTFNSMNPAPFYKLIDPSMVPSQPNLEDLDAVEDILMVGYPNGLWDEENNFPLIRRGITSSHPGLDFMVGGVATTVADIACFPGSSGSPVFVYHRMRTKKGHLIFLGVLFSGPIIHSDGTLEIRNIPTAFEAIPRVQMMMNLGYLIKSRELEPLRVALLKKYGIPV